MYYKVNQDAQRQSITSIIMGLMNDLQKLAPHPDMPNNHGPLFIKSNSNFKISNDNDGMIGSMMMESILGTAFAEAISESIGSYAQEIDIGNAMDCYSEWLTDTEGSNKKIAAHGQGSLARMSGKSISNSFNLRGGVSLEMQNFMNDLPERMGIERNLAYYAQKLEDLDAPEYKYAQQQEIAA